MNGEVKKKEEWSWLDHKPNNCLNVVPTPEKDFFKWWCVFQSLFVHLTNREIEVIAAFLKERYELSKIISDPEILDSQMANEKTVQRVIEACNITKSHYYVISGALRKKHVLDENGVIHPKLIPNIRLDDNGCFQLLVLFKENK